MKVDAIVAALGMQPHPEGGWYVETWRGVENEANRATATAIYFLLRAGERSHWHRVDAAEVWLFHAGAPLALSISADGGTAEHRLGADVASGERPQVVVPAGAWQSAVSLGEFSLVSCVVAPGFEFGGFELAPPGWSPDRDAT